MKSADDALLALLAALGRGFARGMGGGRVGAAGPVSPAAAGPRAPNGAQRGAGSSLPAPVPPPKRVGHEVVFYKQGRQTFEARLVSFDPSTRMGTLERLSDGERVTRPASEIYRSAAVAA